MSTHEGPNYVAIGIDFGTTHSAASWASSHDAEHIHHVTGWPSLDERLKDESQIPTQVDLETGAWGFLVPKDGITIRWLKLLLLEPGDLGQGVRESVYLDKMRQLLQVHQNATGCGIDKLIANFFKEIWEHTIHDVERHISVGRQELLVAVTVPAVWPEYTRQRLSAAAKEGIRDHRLFSQTTITLLEEADAAATYSLYDSGMSPEVEINEPFLVCDCGGGMVDITGYVKLSSSSPAEVQRITEAKGKFCGGFLVDTNFENWIKRKLSSAKTADGVLQDYVKHEWEYIIKRSFSGRDARQVPVASAATDDPGNSLKVPKHSVTQFFARTYSGIRQLITEILKAVEKQHGKTPKKVFLVGGLGASSYLYLRLQDQFQNISQPSLAWSAVVMGAVIMLLNRRTSTLFKDFMETEELNKQCSQEQNSNQVSNKWAECSHSELSTEDLQTWTLRITSSAFVEAEQHNACGTHQRTPSWQFWPSGSGQTPSPKPKSPDSYVNTSNAVTTSSYRSDQAEKDDEKQERDGTPDSEELKVVYLGEDYGALFGHEQQLSHSPTTLEKHNLIVRSPIGDTQTGPLHQRRDSPEQSIEMRHLTSTDRADSHQDGIYSPSSTCSPPPLIHQRKYQEYLSHQIRLLREENEEQRQQIEDMTRQQRRREREEQQGAWRNPKRYEDLEQENIQLKQRVDALEQEALQRSSNMLFIRKEGARLANQLAVHIRENERLSGLLGEQLIGKGEAIGKEGRGGQVIGKALEENNHCEKEPKRQVYKHSWTSADHSKHTFPEADLGVRRILLGEGAAGLIKNARTTTDDLEDITICKNWDKLCWVIRETSRGIAYYVIELLNANVSCNLYSTSGLDSVRIAGTAATIKERLDTANRHLPDIRRRATYDGGSSEDAAKTNIHLNPFKTRSSGEWQQEILKYDNTSSLQVFGNTLEILIGGLLEHRISWLTEATIWSILMELRVIPAKNDAGMVSFRADFSTESLAASLSSYFERILGIEIVDESPHTIQPALQRIALGAISLGQDIDRLSVPLSSDLWYCEYPFFMMNLGQRRTPLAPTTAKKTTPSRQCQGVAFDHVTMVERTRFTSPNIGPDVIVGLVIRPGLGKMSYSNIHVPDIKAKCHVITLHPRAPSGHYLAS